MTEEVFLDLLTREVATYKETFETESRDWIVKGFIDVGRNVYSISDDTKVVSKIIEVLLTPKLEKFAKENGLSLELPSKRTTIQT